LVLTRLEKEKAVIELYKQGKTYRQIAELLHVSFGDISFIVRRETGEADEQERIRMSKASQALKMFEEGITPVQVAIKLDMETAEVDRLYKEYWNLKGLYHLRQVYAELRGDISSFIKLYQLTKKEGMGSQQVVNALKVPEKLSRLEAEYDYVRRNVFTLKCQQEKLEHGLYELSKYKASSADKLESLREHADKLSGLIKRLENSEEYLKINKEAEKKVREILDNKRLIIGIALSALLIAIRNDPDRRLLNDLLNEETDTMFANPTNKYYRQKLSEVALTYYEQLAHDCVNSILNSIPFEWERQQQKLPVLLQSGNNSRTTDESGINYPACPHPFQLNDI
jgi:transcriptional regulator